MNATQKIKILYDVLISFGILIAIAYIASGMFLEVDPSSVIYSILLGFYQARDVVIIIWTSISFSASAISWLAFQHVEHREARAINETVPRDIIATIYPWLMTMLCISGIVVIAFMLESNPSPLYPSLTMMRDGLVLTFMFAAIILIVVVITHAMARRAIDSINIENMRYPAMIDSRVENHDIDEDVDIEAIPIDPMMESLRRNLKASIPPRITAT